MGNIFCKGDDILRSQEKDLLSQVSSCTGSANDVTKQANKESPLEEDSKHATTTEKVVFDRVLFTILNCLTLGFFSKVKETDALLSRVEEDICRLHCRIDEYCRMKMAADEARKKTPVLLLDEDGLLHKETWGELFEVVAEKLFFKMIAKYLGETKAKELEHKFRVRKQSAVVGQRQMKEMPPSIKMIFSSVDGVLTQEEFQEKVVKACERYLWKVIVEKVGVKRAKEFEAKALIETSGSGTEWMDRAIALYYHEKGENSEDTQ